MNEKILILIPPFFWSSVPYDSLPLYLYLKNKYNVDISMFSEDIRLEKKFSGIEKFRFDSSVFCKQNILLINDWQNFYKLAKNYKFVICTVHMMPKTRRHLMGVIPAEIKRKIIMLDIGGSDILTKEATDRADIFFVKGKKWEEWMKLMGYKDVYSTGTIHYDYYLHSKFMPDKLFDICDKQSFFEKYKLNTAKKVLLIAPSNPACHTDQFDSNLKEIDKLLKLSSENKFQTIVKTHPYDYVFHEEEKTYNGIYKKKYCNDMSQYEFLKNKFPEITVIESQDHFSAIKSSDLLFNMSGSHVAWETYFSETQSFSMNFKSQVYYGGAKYLPDYVSLPDDFVNVEISDISDVFSGKTSCKKSMEDFVSCGFSFLEIEKKLKNLIG